MKFLIKILALIFSLTKICMGRSSGELFIEYGVGGEGF